MDTGQQQRPRGALTHSVERQKAKYNSKFRTAFMHKYRTKKLLKVQLDDNVNDLINTLKDYCGVFRVLLTYSLSWCCSWCCSLDDVILQAWNEKCKMMNMMLSGAYSRGPRGSCPQWLHDSPQITILWFRRGHPEC